LEWSSLNSFLEDIHDYESHFVAKNDLLPYKIFCEKKDGHFKRERKELILLYIPDPGLKLLE